MGSSNSQYEKIHEEWELYEIYIDLSKTDFVKLQKALSEKIKEINEYHEDEVGHEIKFVEEYKKMDGAYAMLLILQKTLESELDAGNMRGVNELDEVANTLKAANKMFFDAKSEIETKKMVAQSSTYGSGTYAPFPTGSESEKEEPKTPLTHPPLKDNEIYFWGYKHQPLGSKYDIDHMRQLLGDEKTAFRNIITGGTGSGMLDAEITPHPDRPRTAPKETHIVILHRSHEDDTNKTNNFVVANVIRETGERVHSHMSSSEDKKNKIENEKGVDWKNPTKDSLETSNAYKFAYEEMKTFMNYPGIKPETVKLKVGNYPENYVHALQLAYLVIKQEMALEGKPDPFPNKLKLEGDRASKLDKDYTTIAKTLISDLASANANNSTLSTQQIATMQTTNQSLSRSRSGTANLQNTNNNNDTVSIPTSSIRTGIGRRH